MRCSHVHISSSDTTIGASFSGIGEIISSKGG
jgi:hypothetical protein